MYYQLKKKYQPKEIGSTFLIYLIVLFIFLSPKINYFILNFQLRTDYLIYVFIFLFSFLFLKNYIKKFDLIFITLFFILNFILSFYENSQKEFLKQFILLLFVYISLRSYYKNFDEYKFFEIYKKFGLFLIFIGYIILAFSFSQSLLLENFITGKLELNNLYNEAQTYKNNYNRFYTDILQIKNPIRFQSLCSEPATYSILILPLFYFYLENIKKNYFKIFFLIISILLTHSIYGLLGIILCFLSRIKFSKKSLILLCLFFLIISFNMPGDKLKNLISKSYTFLNIGFDEDDWLSEAKRFSETMNKGGIIDRFKFYNSNSLFFPNFSKEDELKIIKSSKCHYHPYNNLTTTMDVELLASLLSKYNFHATHFNSKNYIGTTACAYLSNLFISYSNLKNFRFFGSGLGSHEKVYKKNIKHWDFIVPNSAQCLGLNYNDGKSYFIRIFTDFGILGLIFVIFLFVKIKNKNEDFEKISKIILFLLFLQVGNYGLLSINIFILILFKNSNFFNLFSKFQKNN